MLNLARGSGRVARLTKIDNRATMRVLELAPQSIICGSCVLVGKHWHRGAEKPRLFERKENGYEERSDVFCRDEV